MVNIGRGQLTLTDMNDVVASTTAPPNPIEGSMWFNTTNKKLFIYTNNQWVVSADYEEYVKSRGENLITNGTGLLGNNTNFSGFTFDSTQAFAGKGSFFTNTQNGSKFSDELIPVDPSRRYKGSMMAKSTTGLGHNYFGTVPFDIDGLQISSSHMIAYQYPVIELTQDLKVGDTIIHLNDVSSLIDNQTNNHHFHSIMFWGYTNAGGYEYPVSTYSRYSFSYAWNTNAIDRTNKTITLSKPFNLTNKKDPQGIFRAGHKASRTHDGGTYLYNFGSNVKIPTQWTKFEGIMTGTGLGSNQFPHGTAFIKLLFLTNRNTSGGTAGDSFWLSSISYTDVTDIEEIGETITDITETLGNMANDSIIDINERQVVKDKLSEILGYVIGDSDGLPTVATLDSSDKGSFLNTRKSALNAGILVNDPKYINVATAYNDLKNYLDGLSGASPDTTPPTVLPSVYGGTYSSPQTVALTSDETATIYYTTNETTPTTSSSIYNSPLSITSTTTLKYLARDTVGNQSTVQTQVYSIPDFTLPIITASVESGAYNTAKSVTLTSNESVTIYYTLDGSEPTKSSTIYTTAISIPIDTTTTLKYFGIDMAGNKSEPYVKTYIIETVKPTIAYLPSNRYHKTSQSITLTASEESIIYYTTDGTTPTTASSTYSSPIVLPLNNTTVIKSFCRDLAGNDSVVYSKTYTIDTIAPTVEALPDGGLFKATQSVTLTKSEGGTIFYTTNGSTPTETSSIYDTALSISSTTTLKYFCRDYAGNDSIIYSKTFTIDKTLPYVTASPTGDKGFTTSLSVTLTPSETATIYYTTDGTTPTTASSIYTTPFNFTATTTLKYFVKDTAGNESGLYTRIYTKDNTPPTLIFDPQGGTYSAPLWVSLISQDNTNLARSIYFSTNGDPKTSSKQKYMGSIQFTSPTTLRAYVEDDAGNESEVQTHTYNIAITANSNYNSGTYYGGYIHVYLTCSDPSSTIYYTANGTTPSASSSVYNSNGLGFAYIGGNEAVLKFIAINSEGYSSPIYTRYYRVYQ